MRRDILLDVTKNKTKNKYYKIAQIQKLTDHGRVAISKTEPIGCDDLYLYKKELYYSDIVKPPPGSYKVILVHAHFCEITETIGDKILIECEQNENGYSICWPLNITIKKRKNRFIKL
jgi:hypothetical protein